MKGDNIKHRVTRSVFLVVTMSRYWFSGDFSRERPPQGEDPEGMKVFNIKLRVARSQFRWARYVHVGFSATSQFGLPGPGGRPHHGMEGLDGVKVDNIKLHSARSVFPIEHDLNVCLG